MYTVESDDPPDVGRVNGPNYQSQWMPRIHALALCDTLNAAYSAGAASKGVEGTAEAGKKIEAFAKQAFYHFDGEGLKRTAPHLASLHDTLINILNQGQLMQLRAEQPSGVSSAVVEAGNALFDRLGERSCKLADVTAMENWEKAKALSSLPQEHQQGPSVDEIMEVVEGWATKYPAVVGINELRSRLTSLLTPNT